MDTISLSPIGIMAVLVCACIAVFVGFHKALRRAGSESRRRLIARAAVLTWAALAVLTPLLMLAALDVLPRWVIGAVLAAGLLVSLLSARLARRSTMRTQGFA